MAGQYKCSSSRKYGRVVRLAAFILLGGVAIVVAACSPQDLWKKAEQATQEVQQKGNELQASLNQKLGEAAAEAEKRFNQEKNRIIDDYLNNLGKNLKGSTDVNLPGDGSAGDGKK